MPYDPTIALKVAQPQFDVGTAMQNALALRNAQQAGQLNQLKLQQEQQAMQEAAGLQNYLASADLSKPENMAGLYKYGTAGATTAKTIAERQAAEALSTQRSAETKKTLGEYSLKKVDAYKDMLNFVRNPQDYAKWVQMQRNDPDLVGTPVHDISDEDLQRNLAMIPTDQAGFDAFKGKAWMGIDKWTTSQQEQAKNKETERAHRASEDIERDKLKLLQDKANKGDTTADAGKELLTSQVISLRDTYDALSEKGGIVDTKAPWYKNLGAWVSSTGPGQTVGKALGTDTQSLRNTIAQSRPLLLNAIKQATGMTAKQMDSNVELQMYLRAATDPTADIQSNRKALQKLNDLFGLGIDLGPIESSATPAPAAGTTQTKVSGKGTKDDPIKLD